MNNTRHMMSMCNMASSVLGLKPMSIRNIVFRGLGSSTGTILKPIHSPLFKPTPPAVVSAYMGDIRLSRSVGSSSFLPIFFFDKPKTSRIRIPVDDNKIIIYEYNSNFYFIQYKLTVSTWL